LTGRAEAERTREVRKTANIVLRCYKEERREERKERRRLRLADRRKRVEEKERVESCVCD